MLRHKAVAAVVVAAALSFSLLSTAQSQPPIFGSQLMTRQERERFRIEHHERMQEHARARGGRGMGPGGQGMGRAGGPGGR